MGYGGVEQRMENTVCPCNMEEIPPTLHPTAKFVPCLSVALNESRQCRLGIYTELLKERGKKETSFSSSTLGDETNLVDSIK
jgi:hypothetical protein